MKRLKRCFAILLAGALLLTAGAALAETSISVQGTGEVYVPADTAVITLGVTSRSADVRQAQADVNNAIAAVRASLLELGVDPEDINTGYINIWPMYSYKEDMEEIAAYSASSTLAIRTHDMEMAGAIIDTAFRSGANTLDGISFSCSDTAEATEQSMRAAVADALAKAQIYADAAGMRILNVDSISEASVSIWDNGTNAVFAKESAAADSAYGMAPTVVQAARIRVSTSITLKVTAEAAGLAG